MNNSTCARKPLLDNSAFPHSRWNGGFTSQRMFGYTPLMLKTAYGYSSGYTGKNVHIAVVCALDNVAIQESFDTFCEEFNLKKTVLSVYHPFGRAQTTSQNWLIESSIDTQWAHVFAPDADISVVFTPTADIGILTRAALYACNELNPDIICMCFGKPESADLSSANDIFHEKNCIFVSSSGDEGGIVFYPSSSPNVICVGGSNLSLSPTSYSRINEFAWQYSGAGASRVFPIPEWQKRFSPINEYASGMRAVPDISLCADNMPGCSCCVTSLGGWTTVGGTSLSAACFSGICACIRERHPEITTSAGLLSFLYSAAGGTDYNPDNSCYYDIIFGKSGKYQAQKGWDFATGLGSVVIKQLLL